MVERSWYVAEPSTPLRGPFTDAQIRQEIEKGLAGRTLLFPSGEGPVFVHDREGLEFLLNGGTLSDEIGAVSIPRVAASLFQPQGQYSLTSTSEWRDVLHGFCERENVSPGRPGLMKKSHNSIVNLLHRIWNSIKKCVISLLVILICFTSASRVAKDENSEHDGAFLKLRAMAPSPLRSLDEIVGAKLARDSRGYVRALLAGEMGRSFFSAEQFPTQAWVAALALATIPPRELDALPGWRGLLRQLGAATRDGIAVVAYETSRLEQTAERFLAQLRVEGISTQVPRAAQLAALWNAKVSPSGTALGRDDALLLQESMERLIRVWDSVEEPHRLFRGRLAARALWAAIPLLMGSDSSTIDAVMRALALAEKRLLGRLPQPDREILEQAIDESFGRTPVKAAARWEIVRSLQKKTGFLCDPQSAIIAVDFMLQNIAISGEKEIPTGMFIDVLNECLVGARAFISATPSDMASRAPVPIALFVPPGGASAFARKSLAEKADLRGEVVDRNGWAPRGAVRLWGGMAGVLSPHSPLDFEKVKSHCAKKTLSEAACFSIRWHYAAFGEQKIRLLAELAEIYPMAEVREAAFGLAANLVTRRILPSEEPSAVEVAEALKKELKRFIDENHAELSALEWYEANHAALSQ